MKHRKDKVDTDKAVIKDLVKSVVHVDNHLSREDVPHANDGVSVDIGVIVTRLAQVINMVPRVSATIIKAIH